MTDRHSAYTTLLMRHRNMLWRLCWNRSKGDYDRCQDLLQEISIALWKNYDKLHPDAVLRQERAWVRWQARSVFYQIERRQRLTTVPITDELTDSIADGEVMSREELINELLSTLTHDEQRMVGLYLDGYRGDEIGEKMGVSRDTIYQRMRRVVQKLKYVMLILMGLLFTSAIAVAVVPEWRQHVLGGGKVQETVSDTIFESKETVQKDKQQKNTSLITDTVETVTVPELELLEEIAPLELIDPMRHYEELCPLPTNDIPDVTIDGTRLVITGAKGELIRVYDYSGKLVDAQRSNGLCYIDLFPCPGLRDYGFILQIGTRPALSLHL